MKCQDFIFSLLNVLQKGQRGWYQHVISEAGFEHGTRRVKGIHQVWWQHIVPVQGLIVQCSGEKPTIYLFILGMDVHLGQICL